MEKRHIGPKPGKGKEVEIEVEGKEGKGKEVEVEGGTLDLLRERSGQPGPISSAEMASRRAPGWETPQRMRPSASEGRAGGAASETTREEIASDDIIGKYVYGEKENPYNTIYEVKIRTNEDIVYRTGEGNIDATMNGDGYSRIEALRRGLRSKAKKKNAEDNPGGNSAIPGDSAERDK